MSNNMLGLIQVSGQRSHVAGYTLIELIMVMVIVGILAVTGYSKFFSRSVFEERGFFEEAMQATRYAQKQAITWGCDVQISFTASAYTLSRRTSLCSGSFSGQVSHPVRSGNYTANVPNNVSLSPTVSIRFDRIGRPRDTSGSLLTANTNISVGSLTFRIVPETGYVFEP